jgi:preprotein translocase subunit SecG
MSNRTFLIVVVVIALVVGLAVMLHTPGGARFMQSLHGG